MSGQKDALQARLDQNYADYVAGLQGKTADELIAMAPEITAAQQIREELADACTEEAVEFLLRFSNPLEAVRGFWENEITGYDHSDEMGHMIWEIQDRELVSEESIAPPLPGSEQDKNDTVPLQAGPKEVTMIKNITTDDLRRMGDQEGLILQGCGGDLQEWVDGINEMLTETSILLDGSTFKAENVSVFQNGELTNLLFPFEGVKLNMGGLAMWRIQTHDRFGGTWLSDYVPNRLGGFVQEQTEPVKPTMELLGHDGNIFSIMGHASGLLKRAGMKAQSEEMVARVTSCGDYYQALNIISEYVDTELSDHSQPQKSTQKKVRNAHER